MLTVSFLMGAGLGIFYFGGLYWTIQRLPGAKVPGYWILGSFLVRSALCVAGFYVIMGDDWKKLMAGLAGFFLVRVISVRWVKPVRRPPVGKGRAKRPKGSGAGP
ncbi:MAG: ATP synthase subunit I [Deltaproteobacteria bacterium]|nr:ATP synthase subunit I [Deltaproteobacteria bacterium]